MNKRSISALISVVLLILVVVILTSIVLNWSQLFANKQVNQASSFAADTIATQDSTLMVKTQQVSSDGYTAKIIVKNLTSGTTSTITAYKILVAENPNNYSFLNTKINLATNIELTPGNIGVFEIVCYPSQKFDVLLYTDKNTYVPMSVNAQAQYNSLSCEQYYAQVNPPVISGVTSNNSGLYNDGYEITLTVTSNDSDQSVTADFSEIDSDYTTGSEVVSDNEDNTYIITYTISESNTKSDSDSYDINVSATDAFSFSDSETETVELDNTAPVVSVDTLSTTDTTPTLTGDIDDSTATLSLIVDGETYTPTNGGSTWSKTITPALSVGTYDVNICASDTLGNSSCDSGSDELEINLNISVSWIMYYVWDIPPADIYGSINDSSATIEVDLDGHTLSANNDGDGTWSLTYNYDLDVGTYDVNACATLGEYTTCDSKYMYIEEECFTSDTLVLMSDGSTKEMKDIKQGDLVLSYDFFEDKQVVGEVQKLQEHLNGNYEYYIINNNLKVTGNHPILINGVWKLVESIKIGDLIEDSLSNTIEVTSLDKGSTDKVYNVIVDYESFYAEDYLVSSGISIGGFTAGNKVLLADGSKKNIEDVKINDAVVSYNEITNEFESKKVLKTLYRNLKNYYTINDLRVRADEVVNIRNKGWVFVKDVELGDSILTYDGSEYLVETISKIYDTDNFYSIVIEDNHNFIVDGLLVVHNPAKPI